MSFPGVNRLVTMIFGRRTPTQIGPLILDVMVSENHQYKNQITAFPIENNSQISDHVLQEPERLSFTGFITTSPIRYLGGLVDRTGSLTGEELVGSQKFRLENSFVMLMQLAGYDFPIQEGTKTAVKNIIRDVDIVTGLRSYSNMILESLDIPRDKTTGETIRFNATFKKIVKTEVRFVEAINLAQLNDKTTPGNSSRVKEQGASKKSVAEQQTKNTPTSILRKGSDAIGITKPGP